MKNNDVEEYIKENMPTYNSIGIPSLPNGMKFPRRDDKGKTIALKGKKWFLRMFGGSAKHEPYVIYVPYEKTEAILMASDEDDSPI